VVVETKNSGKVEKYKVKINRFGFDLYYRRENMLLRYIVTGVLVLIPIGPLIGYLLQEIDWWVVLFHVIIF
jgi:hypothetical protein